MEEKVQTDIQPVAEHRAAAASVQGDGELTRLHPNYIKVLRIVATLFAIPFLIGALVLEGSGILFPGVFMVPVTLVALLVILRVPMRRHMARGYTMSDDRLRVVRGILFRSDTVVPFGRVQHIDVNQGPLERFYGIATLTLHTAGNHDASVNLPGLGEDLARDMREEIRQHIKRETL